MSFSKESVQDPKLLDQIPGYEEIMKDLGNHFRNHLIYSMKNFRQSFFKEKEQLMEILL